MARPYIRRYRAKDIQKFAADLVANPPNECVLWPFTVYQRSQRPRMTYQGRDMIASRAILMMYTDKGIDTSLFACHGPCNDISCVNPRHLYWGTPEQNMQDKRRDGTHMELDGHARAKLTSYDIPMIRAWAAVKGFTFIGRAYGVGSKTIWNAATGKTWTKVNSKLAKPLGRDYSSRRKVTD